MTDDWTSPTGEYEVNREPNDPARPTASGRVRPTARPHPDEIDPVLGVTSGELRIVDAFFYELAKEAAEDPSPPTAAEQLAVDRLRARFDRLLAMTPEEQEAERERLLKL